MTNLPAAIETNTIPAISEWNTIQQIAGALVKSGFLPPAIKTAEAATAIILKGRELAIPPMQSFSHIHIIQGRPTCSSELMLALLARGGVTWEWVADGTEEEAIIEFRRQGFANVKGIYTLKEAQLAKLTGKETWRAYQANMLRARAISNGARMIGPDLLAGMSYTPEEMGAEVNEDGAPMVNGRSPVVPALVETVDTTTGEISQPEPPQAVEQASAPAASTVTPVTPEQIAAGIEALRRDWPSEDTEETIRWAESNQSNPEVLTILRSKWREFFVEFCEEVQSAEPEVYPVQNAVNNARRKYLGEDKIQGHTWNSRDLAKLREYRAHINEKLDAVTEMAMA